MKYLVRVIEHISSYTVVDADTVKDAESKAVGRVMSEDDSVMYGEYNFECECLPVD